MYMSVCLYKIYVNMCEIVYIVGAVIARYAVQI